jgi:hypothetical protein
MEIQPSRSDERRTHTLGITIVGLVIISFGLGLLANNLGWADAREILNQIWPVGLVILGIGVLLQRNGFWGVALILAGAWAFASHQNWVRVNFWAVFGPTLIVMLGGSMIWRAIHRPRPQSGGDAFVHTFAILSGSELRPTAPFQGADLSAVLGGAKLDLTGASMAGDSATIDVYAMMGGIELLVPPDWDVTIKVASFMGGCADKRRPSALPATKHLLIRGSTVMGGIEIKN